LLQTCRNVDPIAEHVKLGCHDIAEMHRHAQRDRCAFVITFDLLGNDLPLLPSPLDRVMRTPAEVCERMRRDGGPVFPSHAKTGDPHGPLEAWPLMRTHAR
jgi:hypothetical protein